MKNPLCQSNGSGGASPSPPTNPPPVWIFESPCPVLSPARVRSRDWIRCRTERFAESARKSGKFLELSTAFLRHEVVTVKSDDQHLIEATLAGNKNAFGELMLRYQDRLFGTLVHMLGSMHDARDITQEAFLSAYEKLGSFRQESSFYSWLFRIAYNAAVSSRRRKGSRNQSLNSNHDHVPSDHSPQNDPANRLQIEESQHQVREALESLGAEYRDAIILKEIEGLRYEEIAEIQDCPIGTVRSRIHRARQLLREKLARVVEREQK